VTTTNQATLLSNDSNHNPLWLDEDLVLSNSYKRSSRDLIENFFDIELVDLSRHNNLQWSNEMTKLQTDELYSWARYQMS
jgi:hypothetical protein